MVPPVELYLDYACPWSYLALTRLLETALRTGSRIRFRPIVLDQVLKHTNPAMVGNRSEEHPGKARYQAKDLEDWAKYCALTLHRPAGWPADSTAAARAAVAADDQDRCGQYSREVFRAYFESGANIEDPGTLNAAAERAGLDGQRFATALADNRLDERVRANCEGLLQRGGFGSPTMFVNDSMFFGNDRVPLVEFAIGQNSGRAFVAPGDHSA